MKQVALNGIVCDVSNDYDAIDTKYILNIYENLMHKKVV